MSLKLRAAHAETNEAVVKLKQLASTTCTDHDGHEEIFTLYTAGYPSLLYGRWLRDYAKSPPTVWRKCFRARVLEQMNALLDDDPTNDTAACKELAVSLFQAGDRKNAGLILATLFETLEKYMAGKAAQKETQCENNEQDGTYSVKDPDTVPQQIVTPYAGNPPPTNSEGKPLVGPHNSTVTVRDVTERKGRQSKLALQLESDAWGYLCDACELDAEDAGTM